MPNMWFEREISRHIEQDSAFVQVLTGPRQCGKSSLLARISPGFKEVTFDDLRERELAQRDPALFLDRFKEPLILDEVQYAPHIFPELKRRVDRLKREGVRSTTQYRLTGSNLILMDRNVKETLTGRASYFELHTLTVSEIQAAMPEMEIPKILFSGGWPDLYLAPQRDPVTYLNDYIHTYVEKDAVLSAGIQKHSAFNRFLLLLAARTGQILNVSELAREVGNVDSATISDWLSVLERMRIIAMIPPYFNNLTKRAIKSPKIYFLDTGLACRLQGWSEPQPLWVSPLAGHLFETLVLCEIQKFMRNHRRPWRIYFWRTRDGEEIDFVLELTNKQFFAFEVKITPPHREAVLPSGLRAALGEIPVVTVSAGPGPVGLALAALGPYLLGLS